MVRMIEDTNLIPIAMMLLVVAQMLLLSTPTYYPPTYIYIEKEETEDDFVINMTCYDCYEKWK